MYGGVFLSHPHIYIFNYLFICLFILGKGVRWGVPLHLLDAIFSVVGGGGREQYQRFFSFLIFFFGEFFILLYFGLTFFEFIFEFTALE